MPLKKDSECLWKKKRLWAISHIGSTKFIAKFRRIQSSRTVDLTSHTTTMWEPNVPVSNWNHLGKIVESSRISYVSRSTETSIGNELKTQTINNREKNCIPCNLDEIFQSSHKGIQMLELAQIINNFIGLAGHRTNNDKYKCYNKIIE